MDKQTVQDALNTLAANSNEQDVMAAQKAQAYAQTAAQTKGGEAHQTAAFNANGAPDMQNVNVSFEQQPEQATEEVAEEEGEAVMAELNELRGQVEILKQTVASEHDKMLRAVAEADNVRKRAEQDVERERKYALEKFVRSLMPVYDALEKALEFSDRNNEATKATIDGVENTLTLFLKEMASFGVEQVDPTGQPFDPNFHQAVSMIPSADVPNNHVLTTMQKGFTLNGRVVRPAMVIVAKGN